MLTGYKTPDPLPAFARRRALAVFTVESREDLAHDPPDERGRARAASSATSTPRGGDKGNPGGGGGAGAMRADFRTTAYFEAGKVTGRGGQGARPLQAARQPDDLPAHGGRRRRGRFLRRRARRRSRPARSSWRGPRCRASCAWATPSTRACSSRRRTCPTPRSRSRSTRRASIRRASARSGCGSRRAAAPRCASPWSRPRPARRSSRLIARGGGEADSVRGDPHRRAARERRDGLRVRRDLGRRRDRARRSLPRPPRPGRAQAPRGADGARRPVDQPGVARRVPLRLHGAALEPPPAAGRRSRISRRPTARTCPRTCRTPWRTPSTPS